MKILTCVESVPRRAFASALDWPGWCRSGRTEDEAIAALKAYSSRYQIVSEHAGVKFASVAAAEFEVIERAAGNGTTGFGAPAIPAAYEAEPIDAKGAGRLAALVAACWRVFDDVVANAPAELRKGPRGGGRDRDEIVRHVTAAESIYARKLAIRAGDDPLTVRAAVLELLGSPSEGTPYSEKGWPPRYGARRIAWHVLDHAWEIEDKT